MFRINKTFFMSLKIEIECVVLLYISLLDQRNFFLNYT